MGHGHNRHAYCVKTRNDLIGNRIVSTCRNDTIGKTQYALLCHFGAYCVFSRFPCSTQPVLSSSLAAASGARVTYKPLQAAASRYKPQIPRIFLSNYVTWLVAACRPPDRLVFYPRLNHKPVNPSSNNQPKE